MSTSSEHSNDHGLEAMASTRQLHASLEFKGELDARRKRCVHWIAEIMIKLLKQIVARRAAAGRAMVTPQEEDAFSAQFKMSDELLPIDEVKDIITLPRFDKNVAKRQADIKTIKLPEDVLDQIHNFIAEIALLYRYAPPLGEGSPSLLLAHPQTDCMLSFAFTETILFTILIMPVT